jgi:hypothetical protein
MNISEVISSSPLLQCNDAAKILVRQPDIRHTTFYIPERTFEVHSESED